MNTGGAAEGLFDKQAALKRLGGSVELLRDMFQFFIEDAPALLETLESSLSKGDTEEAYRAAHSLKGLASNFDAHAVTKPAKQIEDHLRKNELEKALPLTADIRRGVADCINVGRSQLDGPDNSPVRAAR